MKVIFQRRAGKVMVWDFLTVNVTVDEESYIKNPFLDAELTGAFTHEDGEVWNIEGFADDQAGKKFALRFMPVRPGRFTYEIEFAALGEEKTFTGGFDAAESKFRGMVKVDPAYPFHFQYAGTGEPYFWNSTTAYALIGWQEPIVNEILDRFASYKINRIRTSLSGIHAENGEVWKEPVYPSKEFSFLFHPWVMNGDDPLAEPGYDVTRFDVAHWSKFERMLRYARDHHIQVSVIFYVDGYRPGTDPFGKEGAGGEDEKRYYRYAVNRLAAFSNVMWDVSNEYRLFRDDAWAETMGAYLKGIDPYKHLTSVHGHGDFRFHGSEWVDFACYQSWDEHGGYDFFIKNRADQLATGKAKPQVNEEYGYEDTYPVPWGDARVAPARAPETRRKLAWEMTMAGAYQTTGEVASVPDCGGWITGRGDESMTMLEGYLHLHDFFVSLGDWRKLNPDPSRILDGKAYCLAEGETQGLVYAPNGGDIALRLEPGEYSLRRFDPRTGENTAETVTTEGEPLLVHFPAGEDWAIFYTALS